MSVATILTPAGVIKQEYLPASPHLTWTQTLIYQNASFPPTATAGPPQVNPLILTLPNTIQYNELIGITVIASRGSGGSWNPLTDTLQFSAQQQSSGGAFQYELGTGVISNVPELDGFLQNVFDAGSYASQQNWFYFEPLVGPLSLRQLILWTTGTPNAGVGGGVEVYLFRQQ